MTAEEQAAKLAELDAKIESLLQEIDTREESVLETELVIRQLRAVVDQLYKEYSDLENMDVEEQEDD